MKVAAPADRGTRNSHKGLYQRWRTRARRRRGRARAPPPPRPARAQIRRCKVRRAAEQPFADLRKAGRAGAVLAPALGRLDRAWRALVPALQDLVAEDLPPVEEDAAPAAAGAPAAPPPTGPACKAQVDLPNDDDLANWSHHASVATTGDEVLKSAMAGSALVSFVFGMEVTADLVRAHAAS